MSSHGRIDLLISLFLCLAALESGCGRRPHFGGGGDFHYRVAGDYEVWRSSAANVRISPRHMNDSTPIIPSRVAEVAWDDRFVVARQDALVKEADYKEGPVFRSQYWVLDVSVPRAYGPYDERAFVASRRELAVPESLVLKPVESYLTGSR